MNAAIHMTSLEGEILGLSGLRPDLQQQAYRQWRRIAHRCRLSLRTDRPTTEIVHDTWSHLARQDGTPNLATPRGLGFFSRACRNLLVDEARHRMREDAALRARATSERLPFRDPTREWVQRLSVHEGLQWLAEQSPDGSRYCLVVELHVFAEFAIEEIAEFLDLSPRTVKRYWSYAKARLRTHLRAERRTPTTPP
jgi:DNA-directed RNA polymerase specialized sigma24 family protein